MGETQTTTQDHLLKAKALLAEALDELEAAADMADGPKLEDNIEQIATLMQEPVEWLDNLLPEVDEDADLG